MYFFIKLGRHVNHGVRMDPIDFGDHSSKVKVKMSIVDKCGVRGDAMLCVVIFSLYVGPCRRDDIRRMVDDNRGGSG